MENAVMFFPANTNPAPHVVILYGNMFHQKVLKSIPTTMRNCQLTLINTDRTRKYVIRQYRKTADITVVFKLKPLKQYQTQKGNPLLLATGTQSIPKALANAFPAESFPLYRHRKGFGNIVYVYYQEIGSSKKQANNYPESLKAIAESLYMLSLNSLSETVDTTPVKGINDLYAERTHGTISDWFLF